MIKKIAVLLTALIGLGASVSAQDKVVLTWAFLESNPAIIQGIEQIMADYMKANPNVTVKLETFKDSPSYAQSLQVRLAAGQLPDIMFMKTALQALYKDEMVDLSGEPYVTRNRFVDTYKIDGKVLFVPAIYFTDQVLYRKSIFKEVGITKLPTTWPEYVDMLKKIKAYGNGKYIPYAFGGRDAWPSYPISEFGPPIMSGDPDFVNKMADSDAPFAKGTPIYRSWEMLKELKDAGVLGANPLSVGWDQATKLFEGKKAATLLTGLFYLSAFGTNVGSFDDLGEFPLPLRTTASEPLRVSAFVDHFYGITKKTKNLAEAKKLLAYFFSKDIQQRYANMAQMGSSFKDVEADIPLLKDLNANFKFEPYSMRGDSERTVAIRNAVQFDWHQEAMKIISGASTPDKSAADLNAKWKAARAKIK